MVIKIVDKAWLLKVLSEILEEVFKRLKQALSPMLRYYLLESNPGWVESVPFELRGGSWGAKLPGKASLFGFLNLSIFRSTLSNNASPQIHSKPPEFIIIRTFWHFKTRNLLKPIKTWEISFYTNIFVTAFISPPKPFFGTKLISTWIGVPEGFSWIIETISITRRSNWCCCLIDAKWNQKNALFV